MSRLSSRRKTIVVLVEICDESELSAIFLTIDDDLTDCSNCTLAETRILTLCTGLKETVTDKNPSQVH